MNVISSWKFYNKNNCNQWINESNVLFYGWSKSWMKQFNAWIWCGQNEFCWPKQTTIAFTWNAKLLFNIQLNTPVELLNKILQKVMIGTFEYFTLCYPKNTIYSAFFCYNYIGNNTQFYKYIINNNLLITSVRWDKAPRFGKGRARNIPI